MLMEQLRVPVFFLIFIACAFVGQFLLLSNKFDHALEASISETSQAANTSVTRLFINEIYPRLSDIFALEETTAPIIVGLKGEELESVDRSIRNFMLGTDILKVKIYALSGMTVYSSDLSQIGEDKSTNEAFISASQGIPGSQITHRGIFDAMEGEVFERDLVPSYIPIRNLSKKIIGVAELYTDRTPVIEHSKIALNKFQAIMGITMMLMFSLIIAMAWAFWAHFLAITSKNDPV